MKLNHNRFDVQVHGAQTAGSFSIAMNGKAFKVLSDTLYTNKIGSIVREISCNAYDAHIAAGKKDVPFQIHLPDNFEPWFSVKDFGVGLTPDQITNVFTRYFESTKDDSNDSIGAFGLGAKTPFSYTDQFTVTSIVNGEMSMYSAFIGSSGIPEIALMMRDTTDEPNGVEIKLSVKSEDFHKFISETRTQLRFFKVKPDVLNNQGFTFITFPEFYYDDGRVQIYRRTEFRSEMNIVQGNVGYSVNVSDLSTKMTNEQARSLLNRINMKGYSIIINCPIGDIGVTASREAVEYTPSTIANIEKAIVAIGDDLDKDMVLQLQNMKTEWERAKFIETNDSFNTEKLCKEFAPNVVHYTFDYNDVANKYPNVDFYQSHRGRGAFTMGQEKYKANKVSVRYSVFIVLLDTMKLRKRRVEKIAEDNGGSSHDNWLYVMPHAGATVDWVQFKKDLSAALGDFDKIFIASEINVPKRVSSVKSTVAQYYIVTEGNGYNFEKVYDAVEDIDEEYVYFEAERCGIANVEDIEYVNRYFGMRRVKSFAAKMPELVAIRSVNMNKAKKNQNLRPIKDYILEIEQNMPDDTEAKILWDSYMVKQELNKMVYSVKDHFEHFNNVVPTSKFTRVISLAKKLDEKFQNVDVAELQAKSSFYGWNNSQSFVKRAKKIEEIYNRELDKFPVLKVYYQDWRFREQVKPEHIAKYVSVMS